MANLIYMCFCSSKENSTAKIRDSSTSYPQPGQHISIRTFRELNPAPTSSPTSTRTAIHSNGENSRSTDDLQGAGSNQPTTLTQKHLTQEVSRRLLM
ncbi:C4 protein [Tomato leaf curl Burkina Faso virus]|uniref:C4 protein n=1 Tax=Tomato leaf curl Burkina Faso virus TaxID=1955054 RepID=A0A1Q1N9W7_9GEMI|nr:C4 protein [Tomato leaf curl Burkina Faso virus]AQM52254.1 C4 protein [Tomato leaf curl Burkina Faso virus]